MSGTSCTGLLRDGRGRVSGVSYRQGDTQGAGETGELAADLVVDASGRSSALEKWLGSRGGRWTCSLFGFQQQPPTDDAGYNPHLAEQLARRSLQEPTYRYTNVDNRWRPYPLVKGWPDRLLAVGDAVCVFNRVYGQGPTVAAMEAELLGRMLARRRASGRALDGARFAHWYNSRLFRVAVWDAAVWSRFVRVVNMTTSPAVLFHPIVAAKVLATAFATSPGGR
ncbi:NAD(P)/FAD-dependent oxidoreductase [Streptomyces sp. NPDC054835]